MEIFKSRPLAYPIVLAFLISLLGCTIATKVEETTKTITKTTKQVTRDLTMPDDDMKRKIGILDFENNSLHDSRDFQKVFHKGLPDYMNEKCESLIVASPNSGGPMSLLAEPPRLESGAIDNYALAVFGRKLGLNAIVTGSLEDIRIVDELKGVLWTKDTHHFIQVFVRIEVYDTLTGTKLLDETFEREIEIDDLEYQIIQEEAALRLPELNETLNELLSDIGDSICYALKGQRWHGYIVKIQDDKYIISSGRQVGLELGDTLEVHDSSRIIEGVGGRRFFTPGLKIGEVQIISITDEQSEATLTSGDDIKEGSTVQKEDKGLF
ncbi:MAG: hypothetical protein PVG08_22395 [Desulfobacterales bacterium]|jgi:hypothetical protein